MVSSDQQVVPLRPTVVSSAVVLLVGTFFLLQLDGQVYTNVLIFLVCAVVIAGLWTRFHYRTNSPLKRKIAYAVVGLHGLVILIGIMALPHNYDYQQGFNKTMERARNGQ